MKNDGNASYYAVIFTSILKDEEGYSEMAKKMEELAKQQPGYLDIDSARENIGITISYWKDLESIRKWKENSEHRFAQKMGKEKWYQSYKLRICKVESEYSFAN